jgi:hypothetical protein
MFIWLAFVKTGGLAVSVSQIDKIIVRFSSDLCAVFSNFLGYGALIPSKNFTAKIFS